MLTKQLALANNEFHAPHPSKPHTCQTWRRNGASQTWKRDVARFRVPLKYGMYAYGQLTNDNAFLFHLPEDCPNASPK